MKRTAGDAGFYKCSKSKRPKKAPAKISAKKLSALQNEQKYNDVLFNTDATSTGVVTALSTIASGDTVLTREGNKILCKAVEIRVIMQNEVNTAGSIIRFVLVHDKNANGTSPTYAQVFATTGVNRFPVIDNKSRFKILMDETLTLNNLSSALAAQAYLHKFVKIPSTHQLTCYADGTGAVPVSGSLTLFYAGNQVAGAADTDVEGYARLYFQG